MAELNRILGVIPARGGSKGLRGKNLRQLAGIPLVGLAAECARQSQAVTRIICSTDSAEIATVARGFGAETPFLRPAQLATDSAPMWPVLKHALQEAEATDPPYDLLILLDPTCPGRTPHDIVDAIARLEARPDADGIVAVAEYEHNPMWYAITEREGFMQDLVPEAKSFGRRQDVPPVYRICGALYIWRSAFLRSATDWRTGRNLMYPIPADRAIAIDSMDDFERAENLARQGLIWLPDSPRFQS